VLNVANNVEIVDHFEKEIIPEVLSTQFKYALSYRQNVIPEKILK